VLFERLEIGGGPDIGLGALLSIEIGAEEARMKLRARCAPARTRAGSASTFIAVARGRLTSGADFTPDWPCWLQ